MKPNATEAFMQQHADIAAMIRRLHAHIVEDHCGTSPDDIKWDAVGSLGYVSERLHDICDFVFSDGEHDE